MYFQPKKIGTLSRKHDSREHVRFIFTGLFLMIHGNDDYC